MTWARAIHLTHWPDPEDARHQRPNLRRKLVWATIPKEHIKTVNFPSAEQVQRSGLNGLGEVTLGNQFVPEGSGLSALGIAALYEHFDVLDLKQVRLKPDEPELQHVLKYAGDGQGMELLKRLLELGVDPNDQANGGSSAVQHAAGNDRVVPAHVHLERRHYHC